MIHLCIDARLYECSGLGRYLQGIIPFFINNEMLDITLIVRKYIEGFKRVNQIEFKSGIYSIKEQIEFSRKIPFCDIFFSPHYNIPILSIRAKKRVVTIHDMYHLRYIHNLPFVQKLYAKYMLNQAVKKSDKVITISNFTKGEMVDLLKIKKGKIEVIHNGIDNQIFSKKNAALDVKKKYQLPEKYFLFVGNLRTHKNLNRLIKAFKKLNQSYLDYYLVIVGGITNSVHSEDLTTLNHEKIILLNQVVDEELLFIYRNAFSFIFPSYYEGFGYPPLEAMCLDIPTAVSRAASIPEVCNGASLFFNPFDEKEIYNAMKRLIDDEDKRKFLINKGRECINKFTLKKCAEKHMNLFKDLHNL